MFAFFVMAVDAVDRPWNATIRPIGRTEISGLCIMHHVIRRGDELGREGLFRSSVISQAHEIC